MNKSLIILFLTLFICSFNIEKDNRPYDRYYLEALGSFEQEQATVIAQIRNTSLTTEAGKETIKKALEQARLKLKNIDLWLRYLEPIAYKKINGPLPVEWENEVFEKFEKPYRREGAGLTLAELYLAQPGMNKDSLIRLIQLSATATKIFRDDSIVRQLDTFDHFFLCNRLYLLNLGAIYTTGFECPDKNNVIPELRAMLAGTSEIYTHYNQQFGTTPISEAYLDLYEQTKLFVNKQPADFEQFDHYSFIKNYVNPLFAINQQLIRQYGVVSASFNDYTLNNDCNSIFNKSLYLPQNTKGIYSMVTDAAALGEIRAVGKLLFYDPLLSGNNERSCASCHKPKEYFTDTSLATSLQFDHEQRLLRNTPTLINVIYNHLLMLDGKHTSLQNQGRDVMTNAIEMSGTNEQQIMQKVLSCRDYKSTFKRLLKLTPEASEITFDHLISAITYYYGGFSNYYAPFDEAMNNNKPLQDDAVKGFNIFMGKGQCGTCHFVPQFNGVAPPYISSEFEVIGVPADKAFSKLNDDKGRYLVNPATETMNAFRTGSIRNAEYTKPYMHNGVFGTLEEVIDFYDAGGGAGRQLRVSNQTLAADSLKLREPEKKNLIAFMHSLNEHITFEEPPAALPASADKALNARKVGGSY